MRLFFYYAAHSFVNQLKKLFKTWVLIFILACAVLGGAIGYGAATLSDISEARETAEDASPAQEPEQPEEPGFLELRGLERSDMLELVSGVVILVILAIEAFLSDKNGSRLFLPADVSLLFSAPMRPQSVLMFRLTTQLGAALAASIYLLFQIPNLIVNAHLSLWAALAVILGWCFTIMTGKLLQLLLYLVCSNHPRAKPWVSRAVFAVLALLLFGVAAAWKRGGADPLTAAVRVLNAPVTRWIPFWGWIKGFIRFAAEGRTGACLLSLCAVLLGMAALVLVIRVTKADFYEDAMAKSEETAALMERQRAARSTGLVSGGKRKKERGERLRRDGMRFGAGANVFFFKTLYNRFRFARLGYFTKTCETYLIVALGVAALERFALGTRVFLPVAAVVTAVAFFRSLGNPLEQDTKSDYFLLIPERTWEKLLWSLLGGLANCLLDFLPGLVCAALLLGAPAPEVLGWIPFVLAMDFYATCVGTFINLSVPADAGKNIKQFVQILFIYFGLLPSAAIIAVGAVFDRTGLAALAAALLNCFLGALFFALTPPFLDPKNRGRAAEPPETQADLPAARRIFSRIGLSAFAVLAVSVALQAGLAFAARAFAPEALESSSALWLLTFLPQYLVAFPVGFALLRRIPRAEPRPGGGFSFGRFLGVVPICFFLMYAGNLLGTAVTALLDAITGSGAGNAVEDFALSDSLWLKLLFMVVLAPIFEELLFRRAIIDRMRSYGEKLAIVTGALMFGLFHGNFSQFFYAFALGLLFGWVYLRTGKLRWTVALHMLVNFLGGVLAPALLERAELGGLEDMDLSALAGDAQALSGLLSPGTVAFLLYVAALFALSLAGLVLLIVRARSVRFSPAERELPRGGRFRTVWLNAGMLAFFIACLAMFAVSLAGL